MVERSGFQMGRSQEGHDTSLHPEEGWGQGQWGGEGIYSTVIEKGRLMRKYKGHMGWGLVIEKRRCF